MGNPDYGQIEIPPAHYIATLEGMIRRQALSLARMESMLAFVQAESEEARRELEDFRLGATVDDDPDAFNPFPDDSPARGFSDTVSVKPRPPLGTP